jgi:hypothetical protein
MRPTIVGSHTKPLAFAVEDLMTVLPEAKILTERHWDEIAKNKDLFYINPNLELYKKINSLLITARHYGELVGYFLWVFVPHSHYQHVIIADEDLHYLAPEHRKGMNGYFFIKYACKAAKEGGAGFLMMREKVGHEHLALMKRLGFTPTDLIYTKVV